MAKPNKTRAPTGSCESWDKPQSFPSHGLRHFLEIRDTSSKQDIHTHSPVTRGHYTPASSLSVLFVQELLTFETKNSPLVLWEACWRLHILESRLLSVEPKKKRKEKNRNETRPRQHTPDLLASHSYTNHTNLIYTAQCSVLRFRLSLWVPETVSHAPSEPPFELYRADDLELSQKPIQGV